MTRIVAALFPDRATAQRAVGSLSNAGFGSRLDEDGHVGDLHGPVVTTEAVQDREADLRDLLMHAGATSLQGIGADWPGHADDLTTNGEEPIPIRDGERLPPSDPMAEAHHSTGKGRAKVGAEQGAPAIHHTAAHPEAVDGIRRDMGNSPH